MSDKEIAVWQQQGNRRVRATVDSAGHVLSWGEVLIVALVSLVSMTLGIAGWIALLTMMFG